MRFARIKKAIVAGVGAGIGAAVTHQVSIGFKVDATSIGASVGAFLAAGVPVGWAAWKVKNATGYGSTATPLGHPGSDRWTGGDRKDAL